MAALAGALEGKLQEMVGLLKALQEKREGGAARLRPVPPPIESNHNDCSVTRVPALSGRV